MEELVIWSDTYQYPNGLRTNLAYPIFQNFLDFLWLNFYLQLIVFTALVFPLFFIEPVAKEGEPTHWEVKA